VGGLLQHFVSPEEGLALQYCDNSLRRPIFIFITLSQTNINRKTLLERSPINNLMGNSIHQIDDYLKWSTPGNYRDKSPYHARNLVGALLVESERVFGCLAEGLPLEDVREKAVHGTLFTQRALLSRKRFWYMLQTRYFDLPEWVLHEIVEAYRYGPHSQEFISLLYLHYALSDHFTFDFITEDLWEKWLRQQFDVSREDVLKKLDESAESEPQIKSWTEATRIKLAGIILSSLRDFGVLEGKQKKRLVRPVIPQKTTEHILHVLTAEGIKGSDVLADPIWRLFFCTESDVAHHLQHLALKRIIHFERVGKTVVLQTPDEWSRPS